MTNQNRPVTVRPTHQKSRETSASNARQLYDEDNMEAGGVNGHLVVDTVLGALDQVLVLVATVTLHQQNLVPFVTITKENSATRFRISLVNVSSRMR